MYASTSTTTDTTRSALEHVPVPVHYSHITLHFLPATPATVHTTVGEKKVCQAKQKKEGNEGSQKNRNTLPRYTSLHRTEYGVLKTRDQRLRAFQKARRSIELMTAAAAQPKALAHGPVRRPARLKPPSKQGQVSASPFLGAVSHYTTLHY